MSRGTAEVLAADATLSRSYRRSDGTVVGMFVAYFAQQQVNAQIHSPRNCMPGGGWKVESLEQKRLRVGADAQPAARMVIRKNEHRQEVLYWFRTRGGSIAGEYALKWDQVRSALAGRQTNAAFIRYTAQLSDSSAVRQLMTLLQPPLDQILGDVGLR